MTPSNAKGDAVEAVARAIQEASSREGYSRISWQDASLFARAAIEAMRAVKPLMDGEV